MGSDWILSAPFEGTGLAPQPFWLKGTHWALAVKQAFLQNWPRFDSSRAHVCVMMWQVCLLPQCLATLKALCFHQPEKGKGQLQKILPPCKAAKASSKQAMLFLSRPWKYVENLRHGFCGDALLELQGMRCSLWKSFLWNGIYCMGSDWILSVPFEGTRLAP